jgi:hypothetical protein
MAGESHGVVLHVAFVDVVALTAWGLSGSEADKSLFRCSELMALIWPHRNS